MAVTKTKVKGIPTIDVALVVIKTGDSTNGTEYAVDTANQVGVEPQTSTTDAIQLVKLGRLLAQKPATTTITGHTITLTDNVFTPEIAKILQGGQVSGEGVSLKYTPPVAGSGEKGEIFQLVCYSAVYNAAGQITMYEKITYPNCQGTPFAINTEDDVFRLPEYTINSMPDTGEAPYTIEYVEELPSDFTEPESLSVMSDNGMSVPSVSGETVVQKM